jgi:hypothetical protein
MKVKVGCQSQSYFTTGGLPPISSSWRQAPWDSRHSNSIFQLNTRGYCLYVTSPLIRGWVCRLHFLLGLVSTVISGTSPAGLMITFYCLTFETPVTQRARSPYLYPPGRWWPSYNPRHCVPFSSTPMTRRATRGYLTRPLHGRSLGGAWHFIL